MNKTSRRLLSSPVLLLLPSLVKYFRVDLSTSRIMLIQAPRKQTLRARRSATGKTKKISRSILVETKQARQPYDMACESIRNCLAVSAETTRAGISQEQSEKRTNRRRSELSSCLIGAREFGSNRRSVEQRSQAIVFVHVKNVRQKQCVSVAIVQQSMIFAMFSLRSSSFCFSSSYFRLYTKIVKNYYLICLL